jgi:ubiquinone/menaquinone biosynthesis C-methylase UbiE
LPGSRSPFRLPPPFNDPTPSGPVRAAGAIGGPMSSNPTHHDVVQRAFSDQVDSYSTSSVIADPARRRRFVQFVAPPATARVLDIATGPGLMAVAFAPQVATVMGIDITTAMLVRASADAAAQGLSNVAFARADAENLPFADDVFDVIICGSAFHHLTDLERVVSEIHRVCRPGGLFAVEDIIGSEMLEQREYQNRMEQLRDPSHHRCLAQSELVALLEEGGLRLGRSEVFPVERELGEWFAIAKTRPATQQQVRRLMIASLAKDLAGINVRLAGDEVRVTHTFAWVISEKET